MTLKALVHVIDDDASWRTSVKRLLTAAGYGVEVYGSAEQFLQCALPDAAGCVLLDMRMPGLDGLQLQDRLASMSRPPTVVFVSGHGDIPTSVLAMRSGAEDFLTKPVDTDVLLATIERAIARDTRERVKHARRKSLRDLLQTLTPSERKVFDLVVRGKLNKQIAGELGTAERTVKWHRHNLMQKLHAQSVADLVSMAERLDPEEPQTLPPQSR